METGCYKDFGYPIYHKILNNERFIRIYDFEFTKEITYMENKIMVEDINKKCKPIPEEEFNKIMMDIIYFLTFKNSGLWKHLN